MDKIESLILYLGVFLLSTFSLGIGFRKKRQYKFMIAFSLLLPTALALFRYDVGTDFFNYYNTTIETGFVSIRDYFSLNGDNEIGVFLIKKASLLTGNFNFLLGIYSSVMFYFIYLALKEKKEGILISLGFWLFLCIYYPMSLNLMNQFLAISIVAFSYKYIFSKEIYKFTFTIIFASLFHTTALIMLPIYFLWNKQKLNHISKWKVLFITIGIIGIVTNYQAILIIFSQQGIINQYDIYSVTNDTGGNRDIFIKLLLFIMVYIFRKPLIRYDQKNKLYILLLFLNLLIGFTGFTSPWVKRVGLYFEITQIFILPDLIKIFLNRENKFIYINLIILYGLAYFILTYYILNSGDVFPYQYSILKYFEN